MNSITIITADADQYGTVKENIFHALDLHGAYSGSLLIYPYFDDDIEPEHPHNLYLHLHSEPGKTLSQDVKDALLARALQRAKAIKKETHQTKTRVYTSFLKHQQDGIAYFLQRGFAHDEGIYLMERNLSTVLPEVAYLDEVCIRSMHLETKQEQQQFIDIHRTIFPRHPYSIKRLQELKSLPGWHNFTAYDRSSIAGNIMVYTKPNEENAGYIEDLFVVQQFRHRGIGSCLLHTILDYFQNNGIHRVQLELWSANKPAFKLYHSFGFTQIDETEIAVGRYV